MYLSRVLICLFETYWCFWTVVLEKTPKKPLDCKEIQLVKPKGNRSWIFTGRTDAEAETPILWPLDAKNWLLGKDLDAGKDWRQEGKGMTEDEMVGWHHRLNGQEFEQASGVGDGQGSLECCSPWGRTELDTTEWLNWTWKIYLLFSMDFHSLRPCNLCHCNNSTKSFVKQIFSFYFILLLLFWYCIFKYIFIQYFSQESMHVPCHQLVGF